MEALSMYILKEFFNNADVFLLVFIRIIGFLLILPVLSGSNINIWTKLMFAASAAFLITASGLVKNAVYINTAPGFVLLLFQEFLTGYIIGFTVYIAFNLVFFAGQLIDFQIGFSMVNVFDPLTQIQVPIVGNLFFLILTALLIQSGGLHALLSALFFGYRILPIGGAVILNNHALMKIIMELMANFIVIAVQAALPIIGAVLIIDIAMGLLVKAVPQMNVFVVGMPIKLLAGLIMLYLMTPILSYVYDNVFHLAYSAMTDMLKGLAR